MTSCLISTLLQIIQLIINQPDGKSADHKAPFRCMHCQTLMTTLSDVNMSTLNPQSGITSHEFELAGHELSLIGLYYIY